MQHARLWMVTIGAAGAALVLGTSTALAQGSWTLVSAPPTGHNGELAGVATVSGTDAWAVGGYASETNGVGAKPLIDSWNGSSWTQVTPPATPGNTASLARVSASSASDAWAVGHTSVNREDIEPLALHWNGSSWADSPTAASALPEYTYLTGVADISPADAYAVGFNASYASGYLEQWNGSAWSAVTLPKPSGADSNTTLNAISANGASDVWIVGSYLDSANERFETYSLHFNGTAWSVVSMPLATGSSSNSYLLNSVVVNSPADVWAVGGSGTGVADGNSGTPSDTLTEHWNGTAWSVVSSPALGTDDDLTGVTTVSAASDVWAVGSYVPAGASAAQTLTLNWNGTAWSTVTSPDNGSPSALDDVSAGPGGTGLWAAGYSGSSGAWNPLVLQGS